MSSSNIYDATLSSSAPCNNAKQFIARNVGTRFIASATQYGTLVLEDGTRFEGKAFGYTQGQAGEVVFSTGMVGYPEALTDASFAGQILVLTYPLTGNYGVPKKSLWEHDRIHAAGLVVSNYIDTPFHVQSTMTLSAWLQQQRVPALEIKDTRLLTQHIRTHGAMLGKIIFEQDIPFYNPNQENSSRRSPAARSRVQVMARKRLH